MGGKHPEAHRFKLNRSYTSEEIVRIAKVHRKTVENWRAQGLMPIEPRRPLLFLGSELRKFLEARRRSSKRPCGAGELFCVRCRMPKLPVPESVHLTTVPNKSLVGGRCPSCGTKMQRPVRTADLAAFFRATQGQQERRNEHLAESGPPSSDYPFRNDERERPTCNPENERLKRAYFVFLKEARRLSEAAIDANAAALNRFETYTSFKPFRSFHLEQAVAFKRWLRHAKSDRGQMPLSSATVCSTLHALRCFFEWLADQPGFRGRITHSLAQYFNPTEKEGRVASARREAPFPSLEQLGHVVSLMPTSTDVEKRDRALFAFTVLTTARVAALISFRLKDVDLERCLVNQDARHVKTKGSKTFTTWFFPVGGHYFEIFADYVHHLRTVLLFGPDDPLFPATKIELGSFGVEAASVDRRFWQSTGPVRRIFKVAFERAGLPYFHPHTLRKTITQLGERLCQTPEEWKAWSQNLGHEDVRTTFNSYGQVAPARQEEIIRRLRLPGSAEGDDEALSREILELLRKKGKGKVPA